MSAIRKKKRPGTGDGDGHPGGFTVKAPRAGARRRRGAPGGPPFKNPSSRGAEVAPETGGVYRSEISRAGARRWRRNPAVRCASRTQKPGQFARAPGHRDGGVADRARYMAAAANLAEPLAGVTTPRREAGRANRCFREQRGNAERRRELRRMTRSSKRGGRPVPWGSGDQKWAPASASGCRLRV